jgi:protein-S-isoprenylcysteine O-methyltransferase Ste14
MKLRYKAGYYMNSFIFKHRGELFIPSALIILFLGKPTLLSLITGFSVSFLIGEGIRIWSVGFSGRTTRSGQIEAPQLVTSGPYAHLRNPIYFGNFISWTGFCIASTGNTSLWRTLIIFGVTILSNVLIYGAIIPMEEQFLEMKFGETYRKYKQSVPSFFPAIKAYDNQEGLYDFSVIKTHEIESILMLFIVASIMVIKHLFV